MDKLHKPKTESEKKYFKEIQETVARLTQMTLIPDILQVGKLKVCYSTASEYEYVILFLDS